MSSTDTVETNACDALGALLGTPEVIHHGSDCMGVQLRLPRDTMFCKVATLLAPRYSGLFREGRVRRGFRDVSRLGISMPARIGCRCPITSLICPVNLTLRSRVSPLPQ